MKVLSLLASRLSGTLEVRHFLSHGRAIHHFHRLIKILHSEMLYFAGYFSASLILAFGKSRRAGNSHLTNSQVCGLMGLSLRAPLGVGTEEAMDRAMLA